MKLMCLIWFWLAAANVFLRLGLIAFADYPRQRTSVARWEDTLSAIVNAGIAIYLYSVTHV
jgi:hypothetical protein